MASCPPCHDESCNAIMDLITGALGERRCICVKRPICDGPRIPIPGTTSPDSILPVSTPAPSLVQDEIRRLGGRFDSVAQKFGNDTYTTLRKANGDVIEAAERTGGDTIVFVQKAKDDSVKATFKAVGDTSAAYIKAWRDTASQTKTSLQDTADAGKAAARYMENQKNSTLSAAERAENRLREGKVLDSMWGFATEPLKSTEENFAKATQESSLINTAASSAASYYGGPAGAAAYAAWSSYRRTGDANMALRIGIAAGVTSQLGSSASAMPSGNAGEIFKKSIVAGTMGGLAVAAAGGDEQAIKEGFLKSSGAVLIQGGERRLGAYSPKLQDAYKTVQCVSAQDVDCLSNTTWARDASGKIKVLDGNPVISKLKANSITDVGRWTGIDPSSIEARRIEFIGRLSKLPKSNIIPLFDNKWVLTTSLGNGSSIGRGKPMVVLTYVAGDAPFVSKAAYGTTKISLSQADLQQSEPRRSGTDDNLTSPVDTRISTTGNRPKVQRRRPEAATTPDDEIVERKAPPRVRQPSFFRD